MTPKMPEPGSDSNREAASSAPVALANRRQGVAAGPGSSWQLILHTTLFGHPKDSEFVIRALRAGLPVSSPKRVCARLDVSEKDMLAVLRLTVRTYQRRKAKRRKPDPLTSDRLYRLAKIQAVAACVFESDATAAHWLKRLNRALGDAPLNLLDTGIGTDMVERLLMRIEHGVYS